jgi:hypothetical protein
MADNYCNCTVSADSYCRLLSLLLTVSEKNYSHLLFYRQCCNLLSSTVILLTVLRVTVIYCHFTDGTANYCHLLLLSIGTGNAPQADYIR